MPLDDEGRRIVGHVSAPAVKACAACLPGDHRSRPPSCAQCLGCGLTQSPRRHRAPPWPRRPRHAEAHPRTPLCARMSCVQRAHSGAGSGDRSSAADLSAFRLMRCQPPPISGRTPVAHPHRGHLAGLPIPAPEADSGVWSSYPPPATLILRPTPALVADLGLCSSHPLTLQTQADSWQEFRNPGRTRPR